MKTVGEILQEARLKKKLSTSQLSQITKIQEKFIKALEENDYQHLPEAAFVKGFIRNYAQALNKSPQSLLAIFRRDYSQDPKGKVIPRGISHPLNQAKLRWTPQVTVIVSFSSVIIIFIAYLIFQFRLLSGAPKLKVISPQENETVSSLVIVKGTSAPQATVKVNNKRVQVDQRGNFSETISLSSGDHTITIEATARSGQSTVIQRLVMVK